MSAAIPKVQLGPQAEVAVTRRAGSNEGVIPKWLFPTLLGIVGALVLQLGGSVWWAATITERLSNFNGNVQYQYTDLLKKLDDEKAARARLEDKVALQDIQMQTLRERLAEAGFRFKGR